MSPPRLRSVETEDPPSAPGSGGGGGNGGLTRHRLDELERRMNGVEGELRQLNTTCTRIETKMDEIASKSYVLKAFGITVALLIGRYLSGPELWFQSIL